MVAAFLILALAGSSPGHGAILQSKRLSGALTPGCHALADIKICRKGDDAATLFISGSKTNLLDDYTVVDPALFELTAKGATYRIKLGFPSTSDIPFYRNSYVDFAKDGPGFRVKRFGDSSEANCRSVPVLVHRIIDFQSGTITTRVNGTRWNSRRKFGGASGRINPASRSLSYFYGLLSSPGGPSDERLCRLGGSR